MKNDQKVILSLSFDVEQVTSALHYQFRCNEKSIYKSSGACAGTYHFMHDSEMEIEVTGSAAAADQMKYIIRDLTLVSVSTLSAGRGPLSMFADDCACFQIRDWSPQMQQDNSERTFSTTRSKIMLKMPKKNGQWTISGYLSVVIEKNDASGKRSSEPRLFMFDPEGTMGTGGDVRG